jgi:hypothetical protein
MEFFIRRGRLPGEVIYMCLAPVPVLIKMNNNCAQKEVIMRKGRMPA